MSTFGDIERTFADLYEYRWAIGAAFLVLVAAVIAFGYWKGWHLAIWRHRILVSAISVPVLAVTIWLGWSLGSPLFTNVTVEEEFPFAFEAEVPSGMEMEDVEMIMANIAKVEQQVDELMPDSSATAVSGAPDQAFIMRESDVAMLTKGIDTMNQAMENSDDIMLEQGLDMMTAAVAAMNAKPATDSGAEQQTTAVALKSGVFMDADSFHRGKALQRSTGAKTVPIF